MQRSPVDAPAFKRLFERAIPLETVLRIVREGEVIASYPDDTPYPSVLLLGFSGRKPVHVVVARDPQTGLCLVVTLYQPDPGRWSDDFKTKRRT